MLRGIRMSEPFGAEPEEMPVCKHVFWSDKNPNQCFNCGKTHEDIAFEAKQDLMNQALAAYKKEIQERLNRKFPPVFIEEYEYGKGHFIRGKQMETAVVRLSRAEQEILAACIAIITDGKGEG